VGVAVTGVLLLLTRGRPDLAAWVRINLGDALMLLSVVSWAGYSLLVRRLSGRYSSVSLVFWASVAGVVMLAPLALLEGLPLAVARASPTTWLAVVYMGIAASGVGYVLYNLSIAEIGPTRTASVVYSVVPVLVTLLAWLTLGEPITPIMGVSTAFIVAGLHLALRHEGGPGAAGEARAAPEA
jgi:drug/metabolite transporter (DMT)-like permease